MHCIVYNYTIILARRYRWYIHSSMVTLPCASIVTGRFLTLFIGDWEKFLYKNCPNFKLNVIKIEICIVLSERKDTTYSSCDASPCKKETASHPVAAAATMPHP